jgi:hypothetical protein
MKVISTGSSRRSGWQVRMFAEQIAARILLAMEEGNVSLFQLAEKLDWSPARVLRWIDGTLLVGPEDVREDGTLRELVDIGLALGCRWEIRYGQRRSPRGR